MSGAEIPAIIASAKIIKEAADYISTQKVGLSTELKILAVEFEAAYSALDAFDALRLRYATRLFYQWSASKQLCQERNSAVVQLDIIKDAIFPPFKEGRKPTKTETMQLYASWNIDQVQKLKRDLKSSKESLEKAFRTLKELPEVQAPVGYAEPASSTLPSQRLRNSGQD